MLWIHLSVGPLFLVLSIIYRIFPPKKINDFYGYRTRRAMQSQQSWDYANKLSANLMLLVGASTCLIQFVLQRYFTDDTVILSASAWLVLGLLLTIPCTEFYLKKKFGNPN